MKNSSFKSLQVLALASLILFSACTKNNLVIDQDITAPLFAKFNTANPLDSSTFYYIKNTGNVIKLPVGLTSTSSEARTVKFNYASNSATPGVDYTAPQTMTFAPGSVIDTLVFAGNFDNFPSGRVDTVIITIDSTSDVKGAGYQSKYRIIMRKYCDVILADLLGDYDDTREYSSPYTAQSYGPYLTEVASIVPASATTATASLVNLYDYGWGNINATLDWSNDASFRVTIAQQATGTTEEINGVDYPLYVKTSASVPSTFSSCDRSITLFVDIIANNQNLASAYKIVMK